MTNQEAIKYIENHGYISDDVKDMAIKALEKQKDNGWIPCSERLPEEKEKRFGNKQEYKELMAAVKESGIPLQIQKVLLSLIDKEYKQEESR